MLKRLRFVEIICLLLVFGEIIYVCYSLFWNNTRYLYFDSINAIDRGNGYYVAVGSNNNNSNHYERASIATYNKKREKRFEKLYNIGYNSAFFDVVVDENNIVAVGSYEKTLKDHDSLQREALIVKYDVQGNVIFQKDFQLLDNSRFTRVQIVDDGYLVVGQSIYKNTKVGSKNGGAVLAKYDKDGNLMWQKTYGDNKFGSFNDLLVVEDYIYAVGVAENCVDVLCKYDLDGNLCFCSEYKTVGGEGFSSIVSSDDRIYVSGSKKSGDAISAVIVMYDLEGSYISEVAVDDSKNTTYNKLIIDNYGYIVAIGGIFDVDVFNKNADNYNLDGIVGKYTLDLEKIMVVSYEHDRNDFFTDIICNDGEYLVAGYSLYEDDVYLSKFIRYSEALKVLAVESS